MVLSDYPKLIESYYEYCKSMKKHSTKKADKTVFFWELPKVRQMDLIKQAESGKIKESEIFKKKYSYY